VQGSLVCASKTTEVANSSASLGTAIQRARKRAGMTQAALAKALGVPQGVVARLETGGRPDPRLSTIVAVARALGVSLDVLVADAGLLPKPAVTSLDLRAAVHEAATTAKSARKALSELDQALVAVEGLDTIACLRKRRRSP
jgi:transcriptional regulator with XRE-family HTH domain